MCRLARLDTDRHVAQHRDLDELREYWLGHDHIAEHHAACVEAVRTGRPEPDEPNHPCPVATL